MIICLPYLPRDGEWDRLAGAFPADHNFVILVNDKGIDSAGDVTEARSKLDWYVESGACVVQRVYGSTGGPVRLMIWR